ncbi:PAS domain-containing protein [Anoxybacterium hadale]|uniref:PAS domain-containing protein n=1 Tax=Anoxybacterium hadale TaxID=3408580 RepID=A0ACD1A6J1_9FIRM|nr:PAS domain-containing protein [Clostridiales bacterium]
MIVDDRVDKQEQSVVEDKGIITDISNCFCEYLDYDKSELIGKTRDQFFFQLLRMNKLPDGSTGTSEGFLFTRKLDVRNVRIRRNESGISGRFEYNISEIPNSRLEENNGYLEQLSLSNVIGIGILSVPDLILIKANETYLNFLEPPYHERSNSIGKPIKDMIPGLCGSRFEGFYEKAICTGKVISEKEYEHIGFQRGMTYWNSIITPLAEDGTVKYLVVTASDVTDQVVDRRQMEVILDNMSDGLAVLDRSGSYIKVNKKLREYIRNITKLDDAVDKLGKSYQAGELYYDSSENPLPLDEFPAVQVLKGERTKNKRVLMKYNEQTTYFNVDADPVFDENGEIQLGIILCRDVTEQVRRETLIKEQKEELEAIIENMNDAFAIFSREGRVIKLNAEARKLHPHLTLEHTIHSSHEGYTYYDLNDNPICIENTPTRRAFRGEAVRNERIILKNSRERIVLEANAVPVFHDQKLISVVVSHRVITRMVEYEEEIRRQKELLEVILSNLRESIYVFDQDLNALVLKNSVRMLNLQAGQGMNEMNSMHPQSDPFYKHYHLDGSSMKLEDTAIYRAVNGKATENQTVCFQENGRKYCYLVNGKPILDQEGKFLYGITSAMEISDLMNSQLELRDAKEKLLDLEHEKNQVLMNAMKQKDEFLYLITHEFKTPLAVILSALQTIDLLCKDQMPLVAEKYLKKIKQNTFRQIRLVGNLLDITRINSGFVTNNDEVYDIVHMTRSIIESIQSIAQQKGVTVTFATALSNYEICFDEEKYERILLNLLSNALKFTEPGNDIWVELRKKMIAGVQRVSVSVKDSGIGIPADKQAYIFERFGQVNTSFSRQAEGTGIGLYLVKLFVSAMGGEIKLKSEIGKGSTFTVLLPDRGRSRAEHQPKASESPKVLNYNERLTQEIEIQLSDIYF